MRTAIGERVNAQKLLETAAPSHITMRRDGLLKACKGMTTVGEVLRATQDSGTDVLLEGHD